VKHDCLLALLLLAVAHLLQHFEDVLLFGVVDLRPVFAALVVGVEVRPVSDHLQVAPLGWLGHKGKRVAAILELLKGLQHVLELGREEELALLLLRLLPEEEQQHQRL
jgi:hypothetical protein